MDKVTIKFYGDGEFWIDGKKRAKLYSDGDLYIDGKPAGKIYSDGDVYLWNKKVGKVYDNGEFWVNGKCVLTGVYLLDHLNKSSGTTSAPSRATTESRQTFSKSAGSPSTPNFDFSSLGCVGSLFAFLLLLASSIGWIAELPSTLFDSFESPVLGVCCVILVYGSMLYSLYAQWDVGTREGAGGFYYGLIRQSLSFLIIIAVLVFIDTFSLGMQYGASLGEIVSAFFSSLGIDSFGSLLFALLLCLLLGCPPALIGSLITTIYLKKNGSRAYAPKTKFVEARLLDAIRNTKAASSNINPKVFVSKQSQTTQVVNTISHKRKHFSSTIPISKLLLNCFILITWLLLLTSHCSFFAPLYMEGFYLLYSLICTVLGIIFQLKRYKTKKTSFWITAILFFVLQLQAFCVVNLVGGFQYVLLYELTNAELLQSSIVISLCPTVFCWSIRGKK